MIFADVEVLVQAMRMHPQQQTPDPAAREALARMIDALTSMGAMQQALSRRERSLSKNCR